MDLAEHQGPRHDVSLESAAIVTLLDRSNGLTARPRHPEKAWLPDTPGKGTPYCVVVLIEIPTNLPGTGLLQISLLFIERQQSQNRHQSDD